MSKETIIAVAIASLVAGCAPAGLVTSLKPVCEALGPPHRYNAEVSTSPYHAGPKLADRLARDNRVGENLSCAGY